MAESMTECLVIELGAVMSTGNKSIQQRFDLTECR